MKKINRISDRKKNLLCCIVSAVISAVIFSSALWTCGMYPGKEVSFLNGDGFAQALCFSKMLYRHLFNGDSLCWSFEVGMGMPTIAIYAFYALSPFNIIVMFINDIELAAFCIVLAKLMAAAVTMSFFLQKAVGLDTLAASMFAVPYSLCGFFQSFFLAYYFMDMIWILPLLAYALKRFADSGKWILLCLIYAFSFVVQFYCAFMMGVFSVILLMSYLAYKYGMNI